MTEQDFDRVIDEILKYLENDCKQNPDSYRKSGEDFEPCVYRATSATLNHFGLKDKIDYTPGGHGFPDIVISGEEGNKFGIEVKSSSSTGNSWKINGNSVLGNTRVPGIRKNMIVFGKMRGVDSLFRAREYEKCIANVAVTHSPRYLIDLDVEDGDSFFDKSHLTYMEVSKSEQPIKRITEYFRSIGQTAWWLAESTPAAIQTFSELPRLEQRRLMGYAFAHFPEVFSNSASKFKNLASWLVLENSIVDPSLRDRFTAGGRKTVEAGNLIYPKLPQIFTNLREYHVEVLRELENADLEKLGEHWGIIPSPILERRIKQWVSITAEKIDIRSLGETGCAIRSKEILVEAILTEPNNF